jgi:hypothetical protein
MLFDQLAILAVSVRCKSVLAMAALEASLQGLTNRVVGPSESSVHRGLHGTVALIHVNTGQTPQDNLDLAAFVDTTAWPVDVLQPHARALDGRPELLEDAVQLPPEIVPMDFVER